MTNTLLRLLVCALVYTNAIAAEEHLCSANGLTGVRLKNCVRLCEQLQCGSEENLFTNPRCVQHLDRYIADSGADLPPCLPDSSGFLKNELYCYANWQVHISHECNPLFNPTEDEWGLMNEEDGISPYELCSLNAIMQFDTCLLTMSLLAYSECSTLHTKSCHDDFEITGNHVALSTCLNSVQTAIDRCYEGIERRFYFSTSDN